MENSNSIEIFNNITDKANRTEVSKYSLLLTIKNIFIFIVKFI